jgi:hypothetical protein
VRISQCYKEHHHRLLNSDLVQLSVPVACVDVSGLRKQGVVVSSTMVRARGGGVQGRQEVKRIDAERRGLVVKVNRLNLLKLVVIMMSCRSIDPCFEGLWVSY